MPHMDRKNLYSVTFSDIECSGVAKRDVFEIQGSTNTRVRLHQVKLSQHTILTGSSERVSVEVLTGGTSTAVGGVVGVVNRFLDKGATALCQATYNSTTAGSSGGLEVLREAENWTVGAEQDFNYEPASDKRIQSGLNEQMTVRLGINAANMGISGSIVWEETGKIPGES